MIGDEYSDWQTMPATAEFRSCSPDLTVTLHEISRRWEWVTNLGCFGQRPIRGGTAPSSHSFGAAVDIGYPADKDDQVAAEVCPWIVARSEELHIGALHDYRRCRIWHAGRTVNPDEACTEWWKAQRPSAATGMGQVWANHLHLEVTRAGWYDDTPVAARWTE